MKSCCEAVAKAKLGKLFPKLPISVSKSTMVVGGKESTSCTASVQPNLNALYMGAGSCYKEAVLDLVDKIQKTAHVKHLNDNEHPLMSCECNCQEESCNV